MPKVLSTSSSFGYYVQEPVEFLKNHGFEIELLPQEQKTDEESVLQKITDIDAWIVGFEKISSRLILAAPGLKIITRHGSGVDNIDIDAATFKKIYVTNAPGANSEAVADLTFGLILSLARKIPIANETIKKGEWKRIDGVEVGGKCLGIVGMGHIGKAVARRARGFGMRILAFDITRDSDFAKQFDVEYVSLEALLLQSDYVTIHIPLSSETRGIIGYKQLNMMKKTAYLVNTSRGDVIDEKALYSCLKENRIKGTALDVFSVEPPYGNPLLSLEKVVATPHIGADTIETFLRLGMICAENIVDVFNGKEPRFLVNKEISNAR